MTLKLLDCGWDRHFNEALPLGREQLRLVCPYIKKKVVSRFLERVKPKQIQIITRFSLCDFCEGVSDIAALRELLTAGARIRGVKGLHAKVYLFGQKRAIVTSANLTDAALRSNHEFGCLLQASDLVKCCHRYFHRLWAQAGNDLSLERLDHWEARINMVRLGGARPRVVTELGDEGVSVQNGTQSFPLSLPQDAGDGTQAFVKFWGQGDNRVERDKTVFDLVRASGCHWACAYPKEKRPRSVPPGAVMFMGRLVRRPADTLIFGRATAIAHVPGRDDATAEDVAVRHWKDQWPHYIRVHGGEFLAGPVANGISLNQLMMELGPDCFESTQRHATQGHGNTNPRMAYLRQAAVKLSAEGAAWMNARLEQAFAVHGCLSRAELDQLDWPQVPSL
jgi:hypothetical protein